MSLREEMQAMDDVTLLGAAGLCLVAVTAPLVWAGANLYWLVTGSALHSPAGMWRGLARGELHLGAGVWACTLICLLVVAGVAVGLRAAWVAGRGPSTRVDKAARLTGRTRNIKALTRAEVDKKADRLHSIGTRALPIGKAVGTGVLLWSSIEDVCILIAGPRTGKTTCWVIPRIFAARGAVVATSNKRDIVDNTRTRRAQAGQVWVFDPQGIADEPQTFWWNPLSYVADAVSAQALAQIFMDTTRDENASKSSFFDAASRDLVAGLLLAAAQGGRPITVLHRWLSNQNDDEPARILRDCGEHMAADQVAGTMNLVPETRSGVYGGAAQMMAWLVNDQAMRWATPSGGKEFNVHEFVRSTDTLYCLSQEGRGSVSPLVTALTVAVTEAAVEYAKTLPGGRLASPMLIELDEAANVCRWGELPNLYSHFGSRGICVDTILQSWSQGAEAWGEAGVKKLWSASNVAVYGGGVKEERFLADLSNMIGEHWVDSRQSSYGRMGHSSSRSHATLSRQIATVADLQALPAGRAWVLASGCQPVLARTVPWWESDKHTTDKTNG